MLEDVEIIPDLLGSLLNYSKRYLYNQIYTILRDWSLDDLLEEFKFPKYRS